MVKESVGRLWRRHYATPKPCRAVGIQCGQK